jgi:hypothetical protein
MLTKKKKDRLFYPFKLKYFLTSSLHHMHYVMHGEDLASHGHKVTQQITLFLAWTENDCC